MLGDSVGVDLSLLIVCSHSQWVGGCGFGNKGILFWLVLVSGLDTHVGREKNPISFSS